MDTQRLISDARRRARMMSRRDGRPYQTHLDEVARAAGRSDWSSFVESPAEISEPPPPTVGDDARWRAAYHVTMQRSTLFAIPGIVAFAAFLILAPRFPQVLSEHVDLGGDVMAMASMLILASPIIAFGYAILLTMSALHLYPRITRLQIVGVWGNVVMRATCAAAVLLGFLTYAPTMIASPSPEDSNSYMEDTRSAQHMHVPEMRRDLAIGRVTRHGQDVDVELVLTDIRLIPERMRRIAPKGGLSKTGEALRTHPVSRMGGSFDCTTGRLHVTRLVAADSYHSDAVAMVRKPQSKSFLTVAQSDVVKVCGKTTE